jgi:hypothetical protein
MQTLTEDQQQEMRRTGELRLIDPQTQEQYIVVKAEVYDRMKALAYDDSAWSDAELEFLAARTFDQLDNPEKIQ